MSHRTLRLLAIASTISLSVSAAACAPEVGSEAWCENMKKKDKGDWTLNEGADFAKHCVLKLDEDQE